MYPTRSPPPAPTRSDFGPSIRHTRPVSLEDVWELRTPTDRLISALLLPASWLYGFGWESYEAIYRLGLKRPFRPEFRTIAIGNLQVGGLGKTPLTLACARLLERSGVRVAISASGYGSPAWNSGVVVEPREAADAGAVGDEAALIRTKLPDVPLLVGRDRVWAAQTAARYQPTILLLDDGFQHLRLARDADLVIWDPNSANKRCLPAGPLREPVGGLKRAAAIATWVSECKPVEGDSQKPTFTFVRRFTGVRGLRTDEHRTIESLKGWRVNALCAIARPERFYAALRELGCELATTVALKDHDSMDGPMPSEGDWIVTAKDAVKLERRDDIGGNWFVLEMDTYPCEEEALLSWLTAERRR